jgi:hypothetical protein
VNKNDNLCEDLACWRYFCCEFLDGLTGCVCETRSSFPYFTA